MSDSSEKMSHNGGSKKIPIEGSELRKSIRSAALRNLFRKKVPREHCLTVEQIWQLAMGGGNPGPNPEALKHVQACELCSAELESTKRYLQRVAVSEDEFVEMLKRRESEPERPLLLVRVVKAAYTSVRAFAAALFRWAR